MVNVSPRGTERWDNVGGHRMYSRIWMSGAEQKRVPPLVLVHGLAVSGRYMVPLARELARTHCVYVPDLPGFGRSTKPARSLSVCELAFVLQCWLRVMGLKSAAFVANSMGCQIVVE